MILLMTIGKSFPIEGIEGISSRGTGGECGCNLVRGRTDSGHNRLLCK